MSEKHIQKIIQELKGQLEELDQVLAKSKPNDWTRFNYWKDLTACLVEKHFGNDFKNRFNRLSFRLMGGFVSVQSLAGDYRTFLEETIRTLECHPELLTLTDVQRQSPVNAPPVDSYRTNFIARTFLSEYSLDIAVRQCWWPPLYADQWFLPRLAITIINTGQNISQGTVTIEIAPHSEISTFSSYDGKFQDVKHDTLVEFNKGRKKRIKLKIESRFLRPERYMLRIMLGKIEPQPSPFELLKEVYFKPQAISLDQIREFNDAVKKVEQAMPGIDIHRQEPGVSRVVPLIDWRWLEVIKVHPVLGVAGVVSFSTFVAVLAGTYKLALWGRPYASEALRWLQMHVIDILGRIF